MSFAPNDVVFLLGAGASIPAEILAARQMICELERAFDTTQRSDALTSKFSSYRDLYFQIKSSIIYAQGLRGIFEGDDEFEYHIETLVRATFELERYLEHPLYPFIANWNQRFFEQAGVNFSILKAFSNNLRDQLRNWITPSNYRTHSRYYSGFQRLSKDIIQFPLRIFSLNYDLCLESVQSSDFVVEQGFDSSGFWNWRRMQSDISERENQDLGRVDAFLYKLHGSIDWIRGEDGRLKRVERPENVDPNDIQIIFGREDKMTVASSDPFLYYISQFRAALHSAKLIVCIGYSFGDKHINSSISAALKDPEVGARCLSVTFTEDSARTDLHRKIVAAKLEVPENHLKVYTKGADSFLLDPELADILNEAMPETPQIPF